MVVVIIASLPVCAELHFVSLYPSIGLCSSPLSLRCYFIFGIRLHSTCVWALFGMDDQSQGGNEECEEGRLLGAQRVDIMISRSPYQSRRKIVC